MPLSDLRVCEIDVSRFAERFDVCQILPPAYGSFVGYVLLAADTVDRYVPEESVSSRFFTTF